MLDIAGSPPETPSFFLPTNIIAKRQKAVNHSPTPGFRYAAVFETIAFLSTLLLLNVLFGDGNRFVAMPLHPFWIIVLLITVQYGPTEGLVTALLSSAFLLIGNLPEQTLVETMYQYILRTSLTPILWIGAVLVLGSIRSRQLQEKRNLQEQAKKSEEAAQAMGVGYNRIKKSKEHLERRLAEERCSISTVYKIAISLETIDPADAQIGVEKLIRTALNPHKFSLFLWRDNVLTLETAYGWIESDAYKKQFNALSPFVNSLIKKRQILSIIHQDDEALLAGEGLLAGPIYDERTGKMFGILKIEDREFIDLGVRTHETFRIVCNWIAHVNTNVDEYQKSCGQTTHAQHG